MQIVLLNRVFRTPLFVTIAVLSFKSHFKQGIQLLFLQGPPSLLWVTVHSGFCWQHNLTEWLWPTSQPAQRKLLSTHGTKSKL